MTHLFCVAVIHRREWLGESIAARNRLLRPLNWLMRCPTAVLPSLFFHKGSWQSPDGRSSDVTGENHTEGTIEGQRRSDYGSPETKKKNKAFCEGEPIAVQFALTLAVAFRLFLLFRQRGHLDVEMVSSTFLCFFPSHLTGETLESRLSRLECRCRSECRHSTWMIQVLRLNFNWKYFHFGNDSVRQISLTQKRPPIGRLPAHQLWLLSNRKCK